jgi:DNA-binding NtrC family response regulator
MAAPAAPQIRLLIVDDDEQLRQTLARRFQKQGMIVAEASSAEQALPLVDKDRFDVALLDLHLPGMSGVELLERVKAVQPELEVVMLTAHGSIDTAILAMKHGAYDYLTKPFHLPELEIHVQKAFEKVQLLRRQWQWVEQLRYESPRYRLVGSSPAMQRVVKLIEKVAPTESTVLVRGASGTGKELVARAIHCNSARADHPLVTINCAALQETLLESELFGHEKGAFTGAVAAKPGLFEVAEHGTMFIDEVAEMAPGLQAKLLRVLEDGHFRRVGSTSERLADVRVLAATNKALEEEQKAGRFREDLYYRLNVVAISLPVLRDRRQDIPELIEHFLTTRQIGPMRSQASPEALAALMEYDWPGNVRELANVLERAQILAEDHVITPDDLPDAILGLAPQPASGSDPRHLRTVERRHIEMVLQQERGNKVQAAKVLGVSRRALYRLIEKHRLEKPAAART